MKTELKIDTSTRLLFNLSKALKAAVKEKIEADRAYMEEETRYKRLKSDIMLSETVTGFGSREMRESQAELILSEEPGYRDYLEAKLRSRVAFEKVELLKELLVTGRMLAGQGNMVSEMVDNLLGGIIDEQTDKD